jgi:selenocysteine lyase/cysteine desulfurase
VQFYIVLFKRVWWRFCFAVSNPAPEYLMEKGETMSTKNHAPPAARLSRRSFLTSGITGLTWGALAASQTPVPNQLPAVRSPLLLDDESWAEVRAHFITEPGVVYLNNASLGMPPVEVAEAVADGYRSISRNPIQAKQELTDLIERRIRPNLARFVSAETTEIVLTRNASEALHLAAMGFILESGEEVLLTSQEHPAGRTPWLYRRAFHGVKVKEVAIPSPLEHEDQAVELLAEAISPRTRAMAFCHITRGGHLYPLKKLAALAGERGITTIIDGAQALGMLPVELHSIGCDAYAASLHKWMLGPMGTGMLFVKKEARERFRSVYTAESNPDRPGYGPIGTADLPIKAGIDAALTFIDAIGISAISRRTRYLSDYLKARLTGVPSIRVVSGATAQTSAPGSTIFEMEGVDAMEAVPILARRSSIHIDEHCRDGHNAIRISTHFYNTTEEIDRLMNALMTL